MNCCTNDIGDGFLISCVLNSKADPDDYGSVFAGQNRGGTQIVIIRIHLEMKNPAKPRVECRNIRKNSCYIKDEQVRSIYEFAPGKLIVHVSPCDLLLIENWKLYRYISDDHKGNHYKTWFVPLPNFNPETFPFIVVSGRESFNLVNLKERRMQMLIAAPSKTHGPQEAFFFKKEDYGFTMHFCTKERTSENKDLHNWHCMPFKSDFIERL